MKLIPYRFRPSLGFLWLLAVAIGSVWFVIWGLQEPDLDVVWRVQESRRQGQPISLSAGEQAALERAASRHPELAPLVDQQNSAVSGGDEEEEDQE
jgi:hypothetical protein